MHLHGVHDPVVARVVATSRCTRSPKAAGVVRHVAIDVSGTKLAGAFRPGQAFGVIPPGVDERGLAHKLRLYSVASPTAGEDGRGAVIATTVKRLIDEHHETHRLFLGVASNFLCDLAPGDTLRVTGPSGKRFLLPSDPTRHDYVFFATGTGIAPFRGMLMDLAPHLRAGACRAVLAMGSPYASDLLYHDTMADHAKASPAFSYLTALSRERQLDGGPPMYVQDLIERRADLLVPMLRSERTLVYVCGVAGMELGIFRALARHLREGELDQYLKVDAEVRAGVEGWTRAMVSRQIRPTRRTFLEVY